LLSKNKPNVTIVLYSYGYEYLIAILSLKRCYNFKVCVIVTDLIEYTWTKNIFKKYFKLYIEKKLIGSALKRVDYFVLLTEMMKSKLPIGSKPYVVIEGLYNNVNYCSEKDLFVKPPNSFIIVYTGSLIFEYGFKLLLDAFELLKVHDTFHLWISGQGIEGENILALRMNNDSRIKYFGVLSQVESMELQKCADLLINPRAHLGMEFNNYSFPSKIMEYLASGTPVAMFKLPGIPDEYYQYCYLFEKEDPESIAKTILEVYHLDSEAAVDDRLVLHIF
jgi:glycosyltransferase involved in cell wall biosynthesis